MRPFKTAFDKSFLANMQRGVMRYTYKDIGCLKCPLDMALYARLIWELKPKTLIEIGTYKGGSALWFADLFTSYQIDARIVSIDLHSENEVHDSRIEFLTGDVHNLGEVLTNARMATLPGPILVIEDSIHTYSGSLAALRFFDRVLTIGDVIVVEDGVLDELGLSGQFGGGPNRAITEFMATSPGRFEIMTEYCDYFGPNATYSPNGFLRKLR